MRRTAVILGLFVISGACGLVYQVVWVRMLVLVFGTSVAAVSTVLAAFMAGLALGSVWLGRLVDRRGRPLATYAALEAAIGLYALALPWLLALVDAAATTIYRATGGGATFAVSRFVLTFAVLVVPTTLMGGTLPVLVSFVARRRERFGRAAGALYAANTFGAAAGCALAAFVLLERLGVHGTTRVAAAANLAIAAAAWLWSRRGEAPAGLDEAPSPAAAPSVVAGRSVVVPTTLAVERLVVWGYAVSGFAALGYEVLWTRVLSIALGITTTQSLSVMLVTFLVGIALGGAIGAPLADRLTARVFAFGLAEWALGLFGLASIALLTAIPRIVDALGAAPGWGGHVARLFVASFAVMLGPTLLMGLLLPLVGRIHLTRVAGAGAGLGDVYAANTVGALIGSVTIGFVALPLLGTRGSLLLLAGANLAVAAAALALDPSRRPRVRAVGLTALALPVLVVVVTVPADPLTRLAESLHDGSRLLWAEEGAAGTVTVFERPGGARLLQVNGAGEVPTDPDSIRVFRLLGTLPLVLHPSPDDVLVVAYGGGITLSAVAAQHPQRIDCAEIVPGVVDASPLFERWNGGLAERLDEAGVRLVFDDGRNHVLRTSRHYDVIISDSTHPATADSWVLYTREFYRLCRGRLHDDGIMAQWLPLHGLTVDDYRTIVRTFAGVWPHATLWYTPGYTVLLGTPEPLRIDLERLRSRLGRADAVAKLAEVDLGDPLSFVGTLLLDENALARYAGPGPLNTDDLPRVSFGDRRRVGTNSGIPAAESLMPDLIVHSGSWLVDADAATRERVDRRLLARAHALVADIAQRRGDTATARRDATQALSIDGAEPVARRVLRRLAPR